MLFRSRGYLVTGRKEYRIPYEDAIKNVDLALEYLVPYYSSKPETAEILSKLKAATETKLSELALTIQLIDEGKSEAAKDIMMSDIGKEQMDIVRKTSQELLEYQSRTITQNRQGIYSSLLLSRIGVAGLMILGLLALFMYLRQIFLFTQQQTELQRMLQAERDRLEAEVLERTVQLTQLAQHLQTAREDERNRLARNLHDDLGSLLTSAKLDAARIKSRLAASAPEALDLLAHLVSTLNSGIALGRRIIEDLRPSALSNLGLVSTLEILAREFSDMKGFLACVLAAVPDFKRAELKTPIHIAFSYDEEVGCLGVRPMIAEFGARIPTPRFVIVGEPTSMQVVDAHKGPVRWQVEVTGRAAHSSMAHLGVNAITYAARLISELARIEAELKISTRDDRFDPPFVTLQVTKLEGGTANNIIPIFCRFGFEIRALPGLDIDGLESRLRAFADTECMPEMRAVADEAAITITRANTVPPFAADPNSEITALALQLTGHNRTHTVSYATEAGLFQGGGAPAIVCGPGDIAQAHTPNEWIAASELDKCMAFLERLTLWASA